MSATFRLLAALALGCSLAGCPEAQPEPEPGCPEGMLLDTTDSAEGVCVPEACGLGPWGNVEPGDEAVLYVAPWGSDSASCHAIIPPIDSPLAKT